MFPCFEQQREKLGAIVRSVGGRNCSSHSLSLSSETIQETEQLFSKLVRSVGGRNCSSHSLSLSSETIQETEQLFSKLVRSVGGRNCSSRSIGHRSTPDHVPRLHLYLAQLLEAALNRDTATSGGGKLRPV
ncbi:hypothetical protein RchiOBHm_Chr5g0038531 [Rosa chinensis]|uniref:Uncharacterized protein n=1 Tax=Rosa chinensis TaxID=74649 RepID=A0A2P6QC09_ROSCH|nr:hypothetical protein RchiOBHm_Chr5g0038531 [Rosa chinensis]